MSSVPSLSLRATLKAEEPRTMWSLRAVFLLLTACLAVSASPVVTPPDDIQVQENFDISRVRLASLAAMALWGAAGGRSPDLELRAGSLGALLLRSSGVC